MIARNIIICCDGTGNEISENISNVLKLHRYLRKTEKTGPLQLVSCDTGVGTRRLSDRWPHGQACDQIATSLPQTTRRARSELNSDVAVVSCALEPQRGPGWVGGMQRSRLINPFDIMPEVRPRSLGEERTALAARSTPVCSNCRSDDIVCRCTAQWSNEAQEWQLTETFGQPAHCNECGTSCSIVWLPLN